MRDYHPACVSPLLFGRPFRHTAPAFRRPSSVLASDDNSPHDAGQPVRSQVEFAYKRLSHAGNGRRTRSPAASGKIRRRTGNAVQRVAFQAVFGTTAQQHLGIGMARTGQNIRHRGLFDDPPGVHHRHPVGYLHRGANIMSHKDNRQVALLCCSRSRIRIWICTVASSAVVGSSASSSWGLHDSAGNHRPLTHPAGHLMRIGVQPPFRAGDPHLAQRFQRPFFAA